MRTKIDFISIRQAARRANKTHQPMFLCVLKATDFLIKGERKKKSKAGTARGMTEDKKRKIVKETGPITKEVPIEQVINEKGQ